MHPTGRLSSLALAAAFPLHALAQDAAPCANLDDAQRLACYDAVFGHKPAPATPPVARNEPSALEAVATTPNGKGLVAGDYLAKAWELDADDKRGTFVVRTYQPNFLLPAHYSSSITQAPSSPTHPDGGTFPQ